MRIDKLQVLNFQGLKGQHEYLFRDKMYALCQKNGTGKTSFINALRYGLSGAKPSGDVMTGGEKTFAVGLSVDGDRFIRQEFSDRSPKYYFNEKSVTKKDFDREISEHTENNSNIVKIATSSEVISAMKPQEFGDLILSYIPEQLTVEKIFGYLDDAQESVKSFIEMNLPEGTFGTEELVSVYNMAVETRRETKRKINELTGQMKGLGEIERTEKTSEEYKNMQRELGMAQADIIERIKQKMAYEKAKALYDEQMKMITEAENKLKAIALPDRIPTREETEAKIIDCQKKMQNASLVMGTLKQNLDLFEKSLKDIEKPVCPLSNKLKCTTDKSVVKADLEKGVRDTRRAIDAQQSNYDATNKALLSFQKELSEIDAVILKFKEREQLKKNIEKMRSTLPAVPADPGKVENAENVVKDMNNLVVLQKKAEKFEEYVSLKKEYDKNSEKLKDLEYIVSVFSPKGRIKECVIKYYISSFEEECNRKAAMLKKGFNIKFVSDNGITVMTDIDGSGNYRTYNQLSGGEKVFSMFVILDMLCNLTGLRIMIFDELSVLDKDAFASLVHMIKENEDDYDMVILSAAEHDDIRECLSTEGFSKIAV